jgi:hypothetical protein
MEAKTLFFYLIVAIAIAALVIAIVALVNANTANDNANTANGSLVNYTALPNGSTQVVKSTTISNGTSTLNYVIDIPLDKWKFNGFNVGVLGSMNVPISPPITGGSISWGIEYSKNSAAPLVLVGAGNQSAVSAGSTVVDVNLNLVIPETFNKGDTLTLNVYSIGTGAYTINTAAPAAQAAAVFGPINLNA